jgi:hypothetical protein
MLFFIRASFSGAQSPRRVQRDHLTVAALTASSRRIPQPWHTHRPKLAFYEQKTAASQPPQDVDCHTHTEIIRNAR